MGRHHHLRLPEHLYLSPPTPPQPSAATYLTSASSFFAINRAVHYSPSTALFQETGRPGGFAVGDRIPGFKTSAAFFNTLRANLVLDPDLIPPSLPTTPDVLRPTTMSSSGGGLPPPSPSPLGTGEVYAYAEDAAVESKNPLDSIPDLTTRPAVSEDDQVEALHLLADSVAQQRQVASSAIMYHPLTLGTFVLCFGLVYQYLYKGQRSDWMLIGTTSAGTIMAILVSIRWLTGGYIDEAENIGTWKWLNKGRQANDGLAVGDADEILLTRFGDEVIGTVIVRGERETHAGGGPRKPRKGAPTTGVIRGWTVKRRYRRKGVGQGLLEEAVRLCQTKGWNGPEFAADHAHSARPLPATFAGTFVKRERQAREMLEKVKEDMTPSTGKRGKR